MISLMPNLKILGVFLIKVGRNLCHDFYSSAEKKVCKIRQFKIVIKKLKNKHRFYPFFLPC